MDLDAELVALLNRSVISEDVLDLIRLGANPNILNASGYSLLHILIFNKRYTEAFQLISEFNANINVKDRRGHPPLYYMLYENCGFLLINRMIAAGAHPGVRSKKGTAAIHIIIKNDLYAGLDLLEKHGASIHYKGPEGTPLEIMLNQRDHNNYTSENYLTMVRYGADPETKDKQGISLMQVILGMGNIARAQELVALSSIPTAQRQFYTPKLIDFFLDPDGINTLINEMENDTFTALEIGYLGKYPKAKERVIQYIKTLSHKDQKEIIEFCLLKDSALNKFFSVQRGWFMTRNTRGTLAQLSAMYIEVDKKIRTYARETIELSELEHDEPSDAEVKPMNSAIGDEDYMFDTPLNFS